MPSVPSCIRTRTSFGGQSRVQTSVSSANAYSVSTIVRVGTSRPPNT